MSQETINKEKAYQIAKDGFVSAFKKSLELTPAQLPEQGVYGFNPEGGAVFCRMDGLHVGASDYCVVNLATGEFRHLGRIGE